MTRNRHVLRIASLFLASLTILIALPVRGQKQAASQQHVAPAKSRRQSTSLSSSDIALFLPVVTYGSGGFEPSSVAVADVNGDGKVDLVAVNVCANNSSGNCTSHGSVAVLLGNGDGTFQAAVTYDSGDDLANSIAVADVNGDGKPDLVVANLGRPSGSVGVLLGNGDGTFQPAVIYDSGGDFASSVAVADVNGDGKPDLLVANECADSNCDGSVGVLLGNGDGTFRAVVTYSSGGLNAMSVAIADLNSDGKRDLLVANECASAKLCGSTGAVAVLLGNGNGTFQAAIEYASGGAFPNSLAIADLNGDGKLDVVANNVSNGVGVLLGNGDGTFQAPVTYGPGGISIVGHKSGVAVADLNGDGKPDLVVSNACVSDSGCSQGATVGVLLGNGDGTFQAAVTFSSGGFLADWVAVADVSGDDRPDLLVANTCSSNFNCAGTGEAMGSVGVLLNNSGTRKVTTSTTLISSLNPSFIGQAVTFTAIVTSSVGVPPNAEIITFKNGSAVLGTASLSGGSATLTTSLLPAGTFTITASYPGDSTLAASTSPGLRQVVNPTSKSATSTSLISSLNPSIYGQNVTFTAKVTTAGSLPPTGTVAFTRRYFTETYTIGSATLNSSGVARLTVSKLNADSYPLTAVYKGDTNNLSSTSTVLNQVVEETTSAATITSSPSPSTQGQAVTFSAKVTSPTVTPTGPVTFTAGTTRLGTAQLSGGKATLTTSSLPVGSTKVTVTYNGDSNIAKSSASVTQIVR
jgi:hypothetical protein